MRATAQPLHAASTLERSWLGVWADLVKARLTLLVLVTTLVGFYMGSPQSIDYVLLAHTLIGTGLLACGASALNQLWERDHDARMRRTENRPLPSGRLQPDTVLVFGAAASVVGAAWLAVWVNPTACSLGAVTLGSYLFIYTPLKRVTWMNTIVGAVPGALPPLLGWAAARNDLGLGGWALFAILFLWQVPHFLAIAWLYRDDYARAGFVMLPLLDPAGARTGRQALSHAGILLGVCLMPAQCGLTGLLYPGCAMVLGLAFLALAARFSRGPTPERARALFLASIIYLPCLLGLMVWDKVRT
jgi:protoheme IX farnesyltransferase